MKRRVILFMLVGVLMLGSFACQNDGKHEGEGMPAVTKDPAQVDYSTKTFNADTLYANAKVQGRVTVYDYLNRKKEARRGISLDYTASSIEFTACCQGDVTVSFCGIPQGTVTAPVIYVNIYVDGKLLESRKECGIKREFDFVIATGLEKGHHTFKIERQNESDKGELYINAVTLSGEFDTKPANSSLYIEFIGDSITTAYGNLYPNLIGDVNPSTDASSSCYQDGTRGYAYLAAKQLGADCSIVAQQGIGCYVGLHPHTMTETYTQTCYQTDKTELWNFERQPDLVVINLGTNDIACGKSDSSSIQQGFVDFIALVREKNPNAKILWIYGAMISNGSDLVESAVKEAGGEAAGIYAFTKLIPNGEGGVGHPNAAAHAQNATLLAEEIERILGL